MNYPQHWIYGYTGFRVIVWETLECQELCKAVILLTEMLYSLCFQYHYMLIIGICQIIHPLWALIVKLGGTGLLDVGSDILYSLKI